MTRYRLRVALLALGVLFGYGSAIRHFAYGHGRWHHHMHEHCDWSDHDNPKPVQ